jgi:Fe-S cluster assembly ATPase SufC
MSGVDEMLDIQNLYLSLDKKPIINNLNLHIERQEIHGVLGENGTGKSSLAYLIMGSNGYRPTDGKILFEGEDISGLTVSKRAQKGISLAWQEPARFEGLSVLDYISLSGNKPGLKRIYECLKMVGMDPARYLNMGCRYHSFRRREETHRTGVHNRHAAEAGDTRRAGFRYRYHVDALLSWTAFVR